MFDEDRYIPYNSEIVLVQLSEDIIGSTPSVTDLPSRTTACRNFHHITILSSSILISRLVFIVFPALAYSATDSILYLTSTEWLLSGQPTCRLSTDPHPAAFQRNGPS
jgi:hypothetical protein